MPGAPIWAAVSFEFLFGDGQNQGGRYQQQPSYNSGVRCCRRWTRSSRCAGRKDAYEPEHGSVRSEIREAAGRLSGQGKRRHHRCRYANKFLFLVQGDGKALRTASASAAPASPGRASSRSREKGMAGMDAASGNADAASRSAAAHGRWPAKSARRTRVYLGSSLYRIHGSNEPWTIGTNVSSGLYPDAQ